MSEQILFEESRGRHAGAPTRWQWLILIVIFVFALAVRIRGMETEPHFDELWHLELSTGRGSAHLTLPREVLFQRAPSVTSLTDAPSVWSIPNSLSTVTHPPLYPMLLRIWRDVFGESLQAARVSSIVASLLALLVLFDAARRLHTVSTALWATALFAASSAQVEVASQTRNYAVELFFVLCMIDSMVCIEINRLSRRNGGALFFSTLAAAFTHYFAMFAVAAVGVYALVALRGRTRVIVAAIMGAAVALFFICWLPALRSQRGAMHDATYDSGLFESDPRYLVRELMRLAFTPLRLLFEPRPFDAWPPRLSCVMLVLPWLLVFRKRGLLLWLLVFNVPIVAIVVMDIYFSTMDITLLRHVIVAGIGLSVLIPLMVESSKPWLRQGVPAAILLACLGGLSLSNWTTSHDYASIGRFVGDPRFATEPVIFLALKDVKWKSDVNYLAASQFSSRFPRPMVRVVESIPPDIVEQLRRWPGAIIVCENFQLSEPARFANAKVEVLGSDPFVATVAHLTWPGPSTQPTTSPLSIPSQNAFR